MTVPVEHRPEYRRLVEFEKARQKEWKDRYGAHQIRIGSKTVGGESTDQLAVVFCVEKKGKPAEGAVPVPKSLSFPSADADDDVLIPTDVVEAPRRGRRG